MRIKVNTVKIIITITANCAGIMNFSFETKKLAGKIPVKRKYISRKKQKKKQNKKAYDGSGGKTTPPEPAGNGRAIAL